MIFLRFFLAGQVPVVDFFQFISNFLENHDVCMEHFEFPKTRHLHGSIMFDFLEPCKCHGFPKIWKTMTFAWNTTCLRQQRSSSATAFSIATVSASDNPDLFTSSFLTSLTTLTQILSHRPT